MADMRNGVRKKYKQIQDAFEARGIDRRKAHQFLKTYKRWRIISGAVPDEDICRCNDLLRRAVPVLTRSQKDLRGEVAIAQEQLQEEERRLDALAREVGAQREKVQSDTAGWRVVVALRGDRFCGTVVDLGVRVRERLDALELRALRLGLRLVSGWRGRIERVRSGVDYFCRESRRLLVVMMNMTREMVLAIMDGPGTDVPRLTDDSREGLAMLRRKYGDVEWVVDSPLPDRRTVLVPACERLVVAIWKLSDARTPTLTLATDVRSQAEELLQQIDAILGVEGSQ